MANKDMEFITNVMPRSRKSPPQGTYRAYRSAKKDQKSFRITQKLLQGLVSHAKSINARRSELIISIPANQQENFIIECTINKEPKD